jgi:hypothetical protein
MKKISITLLFWSFTILAGFSETLSTQVTELWQKGEKNKVLEIAEARLKKNADDIVGLVLKMDCQMNLLDVKNLSETMDKVKKVGSSISKPEFTKAFPMIKTDIEKYQKIISQITPEKAEAFKTQNSKKPMRYLAVIEACEKDGLAQ